MFFFLLCDSSTYNKLVKATARFWVGMDVVASFRLGQKVGAQLSSMGPRLRVPA